MTEEIATARDACLDIYESGDTIAARMAFREAYNGIIKTAGKPEYFVSLGWDKKNRAVEVQKAIDQGLLKYEQGEKYLIDYSPNIKFKQLMDMSEKRQQTEEERQMNLKNIEQLKNMLK